MNIVYLDGEYLPIADAKISPLDRGFLFGDAIYDVIPSYSGKIVGFKQHIDRLNNGLHELGIHQPLLLEQWQIICGQLLKTASGNQTAIYIHVSRGTATKRFHGFPKGVKPTVFAMLIDIPPSEIPDSESVQGLKVISAEDLRWKRCHVKTTSLLGNVLHYQQALAGGFHEVVLFNQNNEVTEGAASNIFMVKNNVVSTPPLDRQILPGITRQLVLSVIRDHSDITVEERVISLSELRSADEVWFSNSSFELKPAVNIDGEAIAGGIPGKVWELVAKLYSRHKFDAFPT